MKRALPPAGLGTLLCLLLVLLPLGALSKVKQHFSEAAIDASPSEIPDRIILTWMDDPTTTQAVTWRTTTGIGQAWAELAPVGLGPDFITRARRYRATTKRLKTPTGAALYHTVNFTGLDPNFVYEYRVGSDRAWSEWFQFRTAGAEPEKFSFIYLGDAQKAILSQWSRTIRAAVLAAQDARFFVHAGDLVNHGDYDPQWGEWFKGAGWAFAMIPSLPAVGNHEYYKYEGDGNELSPNWRPQFALPLNGPEELPETAYYLDYQGCRLVVLNSVEKLDVQAQWLEGILKDNPQSWTVAIFHHPVCSSARGRDNKQLRRLWKPLFDRHHVDLVLQGHDHTYARGRNLPGGVQVRDDATGPVYVVSVSGPKMYELTVDRWMDRAAENTQLYQIITVNLNSLSYYALDMRGWIYDGFILQKQDDGSNKLLDRLPPGGRKERRFGPPADE